jgi:hypothetical protein
MSSSSSSFSVDDDDEEQTEDRRFVALLTTTKTTALNMTLTRCFYRYSKIIGIVALLLLVSTVLCVWIPYVYILSPQFDRTIAEEMTDVNLHPSSAPVFSILLLFSSYDDASLLSFPTRNPDAEKTMRRLVEKSRLLTDEKHREIVRPWLKDALSLSFSNFTFLYDNSKTLLAPYESSSDYDIKRDLLQQMKDIVIAFEFVPYDMMYNLDFLQTILKNDDAVAVIRLKASSRTEQDIVSFFASTYRVYCYKRLKMAESFEAPMGVFTGLIGFVTLFVALLSFTIYMEDRREEDMLNQNDDDDDDDDDDDVTRKSTE